jgi:excisionase family DNA binding protein
VTDTPLSPAEAAEYVEFRWGLSLNPDTFRRWIRAGTLRAEKTKGGRLLVSTDDLCVLFTPKTATGDNG